MATASPPRSRNASITRPTSRYVVWLGPENGDAPTASDEADYLSVLKIATTSGGSRVDTITLRYDLAKAGKRLVDTTVPIKYKRQIEIRRLDADGEPTIVAAWGFIASQTQILDQSTEALTIEARLDRHAFGVPLTTVPFNDPDELNQSLDVDTAWIFNPDIDDKIEPNRSNTQAEEDYGEHFFFLDPESVRTDSAIEQQGAARYPWTLTEAVMTLCWHLNRDEEWIANPKREELQQIFDDADEEEESGYKPEAEQLIRNHRMTVGKFLPECLDDLLRPYGFGWYLEHKLDDQTPKVRQTSFKFYKRGTGPKVSLRLQRPGETIDATKTNVGNLTIDYNVVELANRITVKGHAVQREGTFPLLLGWPTDENDIDLAALERGQPDADAHPHAYRKFVLNEAGDYNDINDLQTLVDPLDLSDLFDEAFIKRRRKLLPCISTHPHADDPDSYRIYVQWWDETAEDAATADWEILGWQPPADDPGWTKVKTPFSVLEKEAGILFESPLPPEELHALITDPDRNKLFLRVTATLEGDSRISHTVERRTSSPNGRDLELVLDMPNKFFDRRLMRIGPLASVLNGAPRTGDPDEKDDTNKIEQYAEEVQKTEDCAEVSVSVTLDGCDHPEYAIGKLIDKVDGRNLSLDANKPDEGEPRRLQIVGITHHLDGQQRTELLLETFILERGDLAEVFDLKK